jgi:hypothetical protein
VGVNVVTKNITIKLCIKDKEMSIKKGKGGRLSKSKYSIWAVNMYRGGVGIVIYIIYIGVGG